MGTPIETPIDIWPIYHTDTIPAAIDNRDKDIKVTSGSAANPRLIMIATDGVIIIKTASGKKRIIPSGTFNTGEWHSLEYTQVVTTYRDQTTTADGIWAGID